MKLFQSPKTFLTLTLLSGSALYLLWEFSDVGVFRFKYPWALLLLGIIPFLYWLLLLRNKARNASFNFSSVQAFSKIKMGFMARLADLPVILRVIAMLLIGIALARPETREQKGRIEVQGIDIVIALDLSNSMEAIDIQPNRVEAAKRVIDEFISRREGDRLGLVTFGKEAYTHCPLTLDYSVLRSLLAEIKIGMIDGGATAIGNALGLGLARLRSSDAKSRVLILLTDGDNNSGNVMPMESARYAQAMGVKVFTILMGAPEGAVVRDMWGRQVDVQKQYPINPKLLQDIAKTTGGKYYRATDQQALVQNFQNILDELDKSTRKDVGAVFSDAYRPFVSLAFLFLICEIGLGLTRFRKFP